MPVISISRALACLDSAPPPPPDMGPTVRMWLHLYPSPETPRAISSKVRTCASYFTSACADAIRRETKTKTQCTNQNTNGSRAGSADIGKIEMEKVQSLCACECFRDMCILCVRDVCVLRGRDVGVPHVCLMFCIRHVCIYSPDRCALVSALRAYPVCCGLRCVSFFMSYHSQRGSCVSALLCS